MIIDRRYNHPPHNHGILSSTGEVISSLDGALDVHDKHVHTVVLNKEIHLHTVTSTTLTVATSGSGSEYTITVASTVGFAVNDFLHIENGYAEYTHPKITGIAGNVFTLDRRIDLAHPIGSTVTKAILDMSTTAGTIAAPVEYWVEPPAGEVWHIHRILFSMVHGTAGDLGLFGNLTALPNGVLLRAKRNGQYATLTNWKTNSDMKTDMFDIEFDTRSGGGGSYGTSGRGSFDKTGAILRLDGDTSDRFEIYIQDDITALTLFTMKAQGHLEGL